MREKLSQKLFYAIIVTLYKSVINNLLLHIMLPLH